MNLTTINPSRNLAFQGDTSMVTMNKSQSLCCKCGQELSNDDVFCPSCGAKVCSRTKTQEKTGIPITKQGSSTEETHPIVYSNKCEVTYRLLAFVFGCLGVHNFYVGRYRHAIVQLSLYIIFIVTFIYRTQIWLHVWPLFIPYWTWPIWEMFAVDKDNKGHTLKKGNQSQIVLAIILAIIAWAGCMYCVFMRQKLPTAGEILNESETVKEYRQEAERGNADAQYNLGLCYEIGSGVSEDMKTAKRWYRKAAKQGHLKAITRLAEFNDQ